MRIPAALLFRGPSGPRQTNQYMTITGLYKAPASTLIDVGLMKLSLDRKHSNALLIASESAIASHERIAAIYAVRTGSY